MTSSEVPLNEIKLPNDYKPSEKEEFMNPMQLAYFRKKPGPDLRKSPRNSQGAILSTSIRSFVFLKPKNGAYLSEVII